MSVDEDRDCGLHLGIWGFTKEMATACQSIKEDGSPFDQDDFAACVKEMRPLASKLAEGIDLSRYQAAYTVENSKVKAPAYEVVNLIPPILKQTFSA